MVNIRKENHMAQWIKVKYAGSKCKACKIPFQLGERVKWYGSGIAYHPTKWTKVGDAYKPGECILPEITEEAPPPF